MKPLKKFQKSLLKYTFCEYNAIKLDINIKKMHLEY